MLVVLLGSGVASAEDPVQASAADDPTTTSVVFNDDLDLRYWRVDERLPDPADLPVFNYVEQVNRLNATVVSGRWGLAMQLDEVALLANRYVLDGVLYVERDLVAAGTPSLFPPGSDVYVNLEKIRGSFETKIATVQLGDTYVAFGRGLALNLNRNVDIDIDTSVQGTKVVLRPGAWDLSLVAGQANRQQVSQDIPNDEIYGDLRHAIAGLRAERFGLGPAHVGAHGVFYNFVDEPGWGPGIEGIGTGPDVVTGGVTTELVGVGGVDWFAEGDVFGYGPDQPSPLGPEAPDLGYGLYASAAAYPGAFVVLVEGKRYFQTERVNATLTPELYEVAVAPTLEYERVITEDSSAAVNSNDITGGRVQVDWAAVPGELVPNATVAVFRDDDLTVLHFNDVPETIVHPIVGIEWIAAETSLLANVGYRWDLRDGTAGGADRHLHGDLLLHVPLPGALMGAVSLYGEWFRWGNNPLQQSDYYEVETGWTLLYGSRLALTAYADQTTNPLVNSTGNIDEQTYAAIELQVKPAPDWTVKAFYGAYKAGIRCSGGQCRRLPGFDGARLSVVGGF